MKPSFHCSDCRKHNLPRSGADHTPQLEAQFIAVEGDPWAKDSFEALPEEDPAEPDPMNSGTRHWEALLRDIDRNREGK